MVSEYEATKLRRDMQSELDGETRTIFKCVVGLLVVVLLALVSPTVGLERDHGSPSPSAQTAAR